MMLDPEDAGRRLKKHFEGISDEEFLANVRRYNPEFALELGLGTTEAPLFPKRPIDPHLADDLGPSPALEHLDEKGDEPVAVGHSRFDRWLRGFLAYFGRSVQRLFS